MNEPICKRCKGVTSWDSTKRAYKCIICGHVQDSDTIIETKTTQSARFSYISKIFVDSDFNAHDRQYKNTAENQLSKYLTDNNVDPSHIVSITMTRSEADKARHILLVHYK